MSIIRVDAISSIQLLSRCKNREEVLFLFLMRIDKWFYFVLHGI